jgi:DNA (cytosine-5)-methyltransferase 1
MTFGSLFAGIGGMDLGLERAGLRCAWQVEINPFCRRVLAKHWPSVRRHDDVQTFPPGDPEEWKVDLICGGFPCQDLSLAGRGAGLDGERSGLWWEYSRVIRALRPRFVLVENVPGLLIRGLDRVLGTLASLGYDAEWGCISAAALGAPHIRERIFILAYPNSGRLQGSRLSPSGQVSDANTRPRRWRCVEPAVCGEPDGIPYRMDRLRGLGNAVVPQVAEWIGRRIADAATPLFDGATP